MSNILYEYDEQETLAYIAEEQYGLGRIEGISQGVSQGISLGIEGYIEVLREFAIAEEEIVKRVMDRFQLTLEEAKGYTT